MAIRIENAEQFGRLHVSIIMDGIGRFVSADLWREGDQRDEGAGHIELNAEETSQFHGWLKRLNRQGPTADAVDVWDCCGVPRSLGHTTRCAALAQAAGSPTPVEAGAQRLADAVDRIVAKDPDSPTLNESSGPTTEAEA